MNAMPIVVGGAYVEPRAYELMSAVFTEIFASDLGDVVETLRVRLFRMPGVLRRDLVSSASLPMPWPTPTLFVWRLTDHGELLLRHLLAIAQQPVACEYARRREIAEALVLAGQILRSRSFVKTRCLLHEPIGAPLMPQETTPDPIVEAIRAMQEVGDLKAALATERAAHAAALAELNSDFDSFIGHHAATEASCAAALAAKDEEIADMRQRLVALTRYVDQRYDDSSELGALRDNFRDVQGMLRSKDEEIARLKAEVTLASERAIEEHESALCTEDTGCAEVMESLRRWLRSAEAKVARLEAEVSRLEARERDGWREGIEAAITVLINLDAKVVAVDGVPTQNLALAQSTISEALFRIRRVRDTVAVVLASRQEPPTP